MVKRLAGLLIVISLLSACQPVAEQAPFIVPAMDVHIETGQYQSAVVEVSRENVILFPPPPPVDRYPADGVRGMYLSARGAANASISGHAKTLLETTRLNAVVIDYKDDWGRIASTHESSDALLQAATDPIYDAKQLIADYHAGGIYTIARIVCFKDAFRAHADPGKAMQTSNGGVFIAPTGDTYLNPFDRSNWDYLVEASIQAARAGFDEIQFDYVRFPENFNALSSFVVMDQGDYATVDLPEVEKRSRVISDFVAYARQQLEPYNVRLSVDIFGYVTMVQDDGNVGQNLLMLAQHVDVISSMIYPSHWNNGAFGAALPDKEPGRVVSGYIEREKALLSTMETAPISRPWLQSFTASYLGRGNFIPYTAKEVEAQIEALRQAGVHEYLLWDPANNYFTNVNY